MGPAWRFRRHAGECASAYRRQRHGRTTALSDRFIKLRVDRPRIAFSEVLAFDLNGESIHVVHQCPGYSNADAIVHFHVANLVYLGEVFPGDGYPAIDPRKGGLSTVSSKHSVAGQMTSSELFRRVAK